MKFMICKSSKMFNSPFWLILYFKQKDKKLNNINSKFFFEQVKNNRNQTMGKNVPLYHCCIHISV